MYVMFLFFNDLVFVYLLYYVIQPINDTTLVANNGKIPDCQSVFFTFLSVTRAYPLQPNGLMLPGCNIGCKTLFSERGKLALKLTCPDDTSTCPTTLLNKGEIGLCQKHYLPSGASQGLVQLAPLPFLYQIHLQIATGPVVMLHAGY